MSLLELSKKYGKDEYSLLKENPGLENLSFFSSLSLGNTEWIDIKGKTLFLGSQIAILDDLCKKSKVYIYEDDMERLGSVQAVFGIDIEYIADFESINFNDFDTVIAYGSDMVSKLMQREKPNTKLVLIFDNKYGMNYFEEEFGDKEALSVKAVREWVGEHSTYYPYPNYRYVYKLFSDKEMPGAGELSQIKAYDYPKFALKDIGERFSQAAKTGDFDSFANSYIIVAGGTEENVYIKYNRTRLPKYQIKTEIRLRDGKKYVVKSALKKEGIPHILGMYDGAKLIRNDSVKVLEGTLKNAGEINFPFVNGKSLSRLCEDYIEKDINGFIEGVKEYIKKIVDEDALNLDAIFDNFILDGDKLTAIDCEWIFDESMDFIKDRELFIKYRALHSFYQNNADEIQNKFCLTESDFMESFCIDDIDGMDFIERRFQDYIHGDYQEVYLDNYFVETVSHETLNEGLVALAELPHAKNKINELTEINKDRELAIKEMNRLKTLTDNHVNNLGIIIDNLRHENEELAKTLNVYNNNLSIPFRIRRKLSTVYNKKYPKGSVERKKLNYRLMSIFHPIKYFKLTHSEQGKNLIEGEFKIGDLYREKGKLNFPYVENPKVSIIIPVYNQIHYTYACLVSILENTEGFDYEIIIADDVSTDATKEIDKFVSGLVIARNESNQGFLKNCNNAAKKARGKYIFFLNNDTTVQKDWLPSLIRLLESDESIGMVGSKLIYPDGRLQEAGGIIWSDGSGWNYGRCDDPNKPEYNYVRDVDYISGAAIMLSRKLWEDIGGFDERYAPAYCEDSDLAFEVRKRGLRVVYQPLSVVTHFEGVSNGTDVNGTGLKRYQVENNKKLQEKWSEEFKNQYDNVGVPNAFRARERSRGKKVILFVDHYVPTFDKDAGSKTTFQYIKMFIERGYVVKFLPDNFAKSEPYTSILEQMGVEVLYGNEMRTNIFEWIENNQSNIDIAYLNRPHIATKYIDFIKEKTNIKVIYYGHDLHFLRERREYELTGDVERKNASAYWKSMELDLMRKASISYYPSNVEVDYIHTFDKRINAKAITAYVFEKFGNIDYNPDIREGVLFVGGFSHPPNADALKYFLDNMWDEIYAQIKAPFYIVGSNATDEIKALHNEAKGIIFKGFVSEEELKELYEKVRLVVVPLRYGAGVKGKVIEALYYNDPVITTSVGAEGIDNSYNQMLVADEPGDFVEKCVKLYNDKEALKAMSKAADDYVRNKHSIEAVWEIIREDF
ncbi:glycosyltransferase [Lachnoanaerobaculum gingivalis]|uniref:Glycosyltransferase n=1 Tax=Lachnoanaerobaculum gingivalis TaxID=2490855 RepID=A0A3P3QU71_9FIRM|nr:glycosyltransferase [Lachnoanaerobaculum gingivalis]RRJ24298.1 glycosyltransferase [Lachnoanaerobaculum gingivalis]